jgi:hypothetical protein
LRRPFGGELILDVIANRLSELGFFLGSIWFVPARSVLTLLMLLLVASTTNVGDMEDLQKSLG